MIKIGSAALKHWYPECRDPKDLDFLVKDKSLYQSKKGVEYFEIPCLWYYIDETEKFLPPDLLYTLKVSHILFDIKWDKHIYDIQFLQQKCCVLNKELFYKLHEFWKVVHRNKRTDFNKSNEEFFKDKVGRVYHHDDLHKIVMYYEQPIFNKIKKDLSSAEIDEEMFNHLDFNDKLKVVREETYVIALERWLLTELTNNIQVAYFRALKALITRLSPVWLVLFIIENYQELKKPDLNYYDKFKRYNSNNNQYFKAA